MVQALINLGSKVNTRNLNFAKKINLQLHKTKIGTQKVDDSKLNIFDIIIASLSKKNKEEKSCIFEKMFLLANISMNIALKISFLTLSNIEINFVGHHIYWRIYTVAKVLLIVRQVELIRKKEFADVALDLENKTFVVHETSISQDWDIYHFRRIQMALLKADETYISVSTKYSTMILQMLFLKI